MKYLKIILAFILLVIVIQSCQKQIVSSERPGITPDSVYHPSGLLKKKVDTYLPNNMEWFITEYEYDSSNRLSIIKFYEKIRNADGSFRDSSVQAKFFRDNIGRIIRTATLPDTSSVSSIISYKTDTSPEVLNITIYRSFSTVQKLMLDSIVFEYDNKGMISKTSRYQPIAGGVIRKILYCQYLYDNNGNLVEAKQFQDDNNDGTFQAVLTYEWEFNNHINPEYFNDPAYFSLQGQLFPYTASPYLTFKQTNHSYLGNDDDVKYTFQFDSMDRLIMTKKVGDADNETRYYYY